MPHRRRAHSGVASALPPWYTDPVRWRVVAGHGGATVRRPVPAMIHPTAVIAREVQLDPTVEVGPYVVIEDRVVVGPGNVIGPHVHLLSGTVVGAHNQFHAGCVVGGPPQDLKYRGEPTGLRIGDHNVFREHVTVNRSNRPEEQTRVGSHGFYMAHCHIAHNCVLGDGVILANGVLLGGHVEVQDRAFLSGNCLIHQFTRVGTLALMQGGSAISKDLPPYTVARGDNRICGLNTVGLRRAGFTSDQRRELRQLYHRLFRSGEALQTVLAEAQTQFTQPISRVLLDFVAQSRRGLCADPGRSAPFRSKAAAAAEDTP